ncbi:hypothetical protein BFP72_02195 [Reichenbachiella sp. 5M10]|nr:hypothetical protein BFP72_02195 [Reichenbachiella sp. 5M10]
MLTVWTMLVCACAAPQDQVGSRFEQLPSTTTQITFSNQIQESDTLNYFKYPYLYMGGGVAVADFDGDGLEDIYFTGNMTANKLYRNTGNLVFEDVTEAAGVAGAEYKWYTGVSAVDINADGYMDLYLSVAGLGEDRANELYLNNGDMTFTESAKKMGLADNQNSVQTAFVDFDHDGDLDVYVANYPITSFKTANESYRYMIDRPDPAKSDHLYRNEGNGVFVDYTAQAGLLSFGLSLSATIVDFNQDGWEDIYVSNDFSTPDQFYINQGDGTFVERVKYITRQTSFYGMGADAADINNDGLIDLMQVDMSSENNRRQKANMASMNPELFWSTVNNGFHYQYMYNSLQLNQGIVDDLPVMSNIAWLAGVSSTDWSWAPLLADFDNDGYKDLFIANGTRREINNRDYFKKLNNQLDDASDQELLQMAREIPSEPIDNYIFQNQSGEGFVKKNKEWGVSFEGFSNGAAYGDLDNDGDLELIVNNIDAEALIYKNNTVENGEGGYLRIDLQSANNTSGIGTEVRIYQAGKLQVAQVQPVRGFQSSVEPTLHFGTGSHPVIDSLSIYAAGRKQQTMYNVLANQTLEIKVIEASPLALEKQESTIDPLMKEVTLEHLGEMLYHRENGFNDFHFQVLLPHKMSNFGPALAVGDIDGDGVEDLYIGAAAGRVGYIYRGLAEGGFAAREALEESSPWHEDLDAAFFDADRDGDLDLYIVSGGNEFPEGHPNYQDRLFINEEGKLIESSGVLPVQAESGACVRPYDYDGDGDLDLFIGTRLTPYNYPFASKSLLFENKHEEGQLKFVDVTEAVMPDLDGIGMVTDAIWTDVNGDQQMDLMIVGEWMPVKTLIQKDGKFSDQSASYFEDNMTGWWFSIDQGDFDHDGDMDYVLGNMGRNYKYQANRGEPFAIYADDFDDNNKSDIVLSYHAEGEEYPVRGRQCSSEQIPAIQVVFKDYNSFANADMQEIYGTENLDNSYHFEVEDFSSIYLEHTADGLKKNILPYAAQVSSINDWVVSDINQDGHLDLLSVGGLYASEVETPRNDAGIGLVMLGNGKGGFAPQSMSQSGLCVPHDAKKVVALGQNHIVVASNKGPLQIFEVKE